MTRRQYKLKELADLVGGAVSGDGSVPIRGVAGIREAADGDITFLASPQYERYLETTRASAIIASSTRCGRLPTITLDNPYLAFLKVLAVFARSALDRYPRGIHPTAIVDESVQLGANVGIGPYCQINAGTRIGANTTLLAGSYVGEGVVIGDHGLVYPHVTIREASRIGNRVIIHPGAVIGSDGFGFVQDGDVHVKIPHIGHVVIEDDVEIGANTTIDRGTTGVTRVGKGTKLDNLVQIAHNVTIGENCIIAGQVGISGSTVLGKNVVIAGQAGLVGHIELGDGVVIGAQAGVTKSIPANTTISGYPARPHDQARKLYGFTTRLPGMFQRMRELEQRLERLETDKSDDQATEND